MEDLRYIRDETKFLAYSYLALKDHFCSEKQFDDYYNAIKTYNLKNLFLKTASFYLFLVKRGVWSVDIPDYEKEIQYLTISYQYIAVFSLIGSLSEANFIDFNEFLIRKKSNVTFPITNKDDLKIYYKQYKEEFGSIRQFVNFFQALSLERQQDLISKLTNKLSVMGSKTIAPPIKDLPKHLENLAKYLYDLRSKFIHEAKLILPMLPGTTVGLRGGKLVVCNLTIQDVMQFFEEGLLVHFQKGSRGQRN